MKPIKNSLRLWITLGSVISFLGGWALLSHSGKPTPLIQTQLAEPTAVTNPVISTPIDPIPSIENLDNTTLQPLPTLPSFSYNNSSTQLFTPRLRTRGS